MRCSNENYHLCVDSRGIIVMRSLHRVDTNYIHPGPLGVKDQPNRTFTTYPSFGGARKHSYVMNPSHFEVTETVVFLLFFSFLASSGPICPFPVSWPAATFILYPFCPCFRELIIPVPCYWSPASVLVLRLGYSMDETTALKKSRCPGTPACSAIRPALDSSLGPGRQTFIRSILLPSFRFCSFFDASSFGSPLVFISFSFLSRVKKAQHNAGFRSPSDRREPCCCCPCRAPRHLCWRDFCALCCGCWLPCWIPSRPGSVHFSPLSGDISDSNESRFRFALGTWYDPGLGACGITNTDSDYIAAVSHSLFDTYP